MMKFSIAPKLFFLKAVLNLFLSSSADIWHTYEELHYENNEDVGIISTCVDLCVADDYAVRSNVVNYENINVNITFYPNTSTAEQQLQAHYFSTNDIYNFQSVSTQYLHESLVAVPYSNNNTFKILNGYVLVKDQVYVKSNNNTGIMLVSNIHLSYLLPTAPPPSDELSSMLSTYYNDESYTKTLQENNIIDDTTNVTVSFTHTNNYEIFHPLSTQASYMISQVASYNPTKNNDAMYIIIISALSTIIMILFLIVLQITGIFDLTKPLHKCRSRRYIDNDDESSIHTKTIPDNMQSKCIEPYSENNANEFKITPLRGIYKHTHADDDEVDESAFDLSADEINISNDNNDSNKNSNSLGITSMYNLHSSRKKCTLGEKYDPTKLITSNSQSVHSPVSNSSTVPTLQSKSIDSDERNKENIMDYHMA